MRTYFSRQDAFSITLLLNNKPIGRIETNMADIMHLAGRTLDQPVCLDGTFSVSLNQSLYSPKISRSNIYFLSQLLDSNGQSQARVVLRFSLKRNESPGAGDIFDGLVQESNNALSAPPEVQNSNHVAPGKEEAPFFSSTKAYFDNMLFSHLRMHRGKSWKSFFTKVCMERFRVTIGVTEFLPF